MQASSPLRRRQQTTALRGGGLAWSVCGTLGRAVAMLSGGEFTPLSANRGGVKTAAKFLKR